MIKHLLFLFAAIILFSTVHSADAGPRIYVTTAACRPVVVRPQLVYYYNYYRAVPCRPIVRQPVYYQPVYRPVVYASPTLCTPRVARAPVVVRTVGVSRYGAVRWRR